MTRSPISRFGYFVRWQCVPVLAALPGHLAFVARGTGAARSGVGQRAAIAVRCAWIHLRVQCLHNPMELLTIVEEILELPPSTEGAIVECGAFTGGSSAKLSLAVAAASRQLIVCDSFEGLPATSADDRSQAGKTDFRQGDYASPLRRVQENVRRHGRPEVVSYVRGLFDQSLPSLRETPLACAYWDVDLAESFRSCLRHLWTALQPRAKAFVHDVDRQAVVAVFTDAEWWRRELGIQPPTLVGAGHGLSKTAPLLGYAVRTIRMEAGSSDPAI